VAFRCAYVSNLTFTAVEQEALCEGLLQDLAVDASCEVMHVDNLGASAGVRVAADFLVADGSAVSRIRTRMQQAGAGNATVTAFNAAFASRGGAPYQGASLAMSFAGMHLITSAPTPAPKPAPTPAPFFTALSDGGMSGGTVAALVLAASALACCGGLLVGTRWQKVMAKYRQRTCWGCLRRAWHAHRSPKDRATADRIKAGGTAEAVAVANPLKVEL
jgi:hypothetical protein